MRRMSDTDIVISPDDRPGPRQRPPARGDAPKRKAPRPPAAAKAAPTRQRHPPLLPLTPLQKVVAVGIAAIAVVVGALVLLHSGAPQRAGRAAVEAMLGLTARAGFRVEDITVTGRGRTAGEQILAALRAPQGAPILGIDIEAAKDRLEEIPTVRAAAVERHLPHALRVIIAERRPVALWQNDGAFVLIDGDGHQIPGAIKGFEDLPLVVGDGAPAATNALLAMLASEPALADRVKSAVRVGARRWDIRLDDPVGGLEARLPEDQPAEAWHRLAQLEGDHGLTKRHVVMVDLRFADRLVLRTQPPEPGHQQAAVERRKSSGG